MVVLRRGRTVQLYTALSSHLSDSLSVFARGARFFFSSYRCVQSRMSPRAGRRAPGPGRVGTDCN